MLGKPILAGGEMNGTGESGLTFGRRSAVLGSAAVVFPYQPDFGERCRASRSGLGTIPDQPEPD